MSKLKSILTKEYGNTNLKSIISAIPEHFYDLMSFILPLCMFGSLLIEEIVYCTFETSIFFHLFTFFGYLNIVVTSLYVVSLLLSDNLCDLLSEFKKHIWDIFLSLMLLLSFISACFAENKFVAFTGTPYRNDGLSTYFVYLSMYICGKLINKDSKKLLILKAISITISLLSVVSVIQALSDTFALTNILNKKWAYLYKFASIYNNTNHYAYLLTMGLLALTGIVIIEKSIHIKFIYLCLYAYNLWALLINDTLGCYIAVILGTIFISILFFVNNKNSFKYCLIIIITLIIVSIAVNNSTNIISNNYSVTSHDAKTMSTNDHGGSGRIGLWKQAFKYIKEKPILGYGPEGLYQKYFDDGFDNDRPHNEYIQHAAFLGIPALIMYLLALFSLFVFCLVNIKKLDKTYLVLGGIVFAYCISAFFGNTMYNTTPYYFLFLGMLSTCHNYVVKNKN